MTEASANRSSSTDDGIAFEFLGSVARVTFVRPEKRNAMNRAAQRALLDVLDRAREAQVVVLSGTGTAFCSGVDLKERRSITDGQSARDYAAVKNLWIEVNEAVRLHPAVVICAVNGYALGGGLTLVQSSDLAVAASSAEFGMPEVTFGAVPAYAGPATHKRLAHKRSSFMALTGGRISAETAYEWGLVNDVVPDDELVPRTDALVQQVTSLDANATRLTKRLLRETEEVAWRQALELGALVGTMARLSGQ